MRADELNATHIGQRIRFKLDGSLVEDILAGVSHQASIINDSAMYQAHPTYITGCRSTCITLLYFGSPQVPADLKVEIP